MGCSTPQTSPNILLLFTDQQRADTIGALGNPVIKTPALDTLVREGTSFERAYTASPVCVPSRHALITGLPPHRSGVVDNVERAADTRSMMEMLAACGYQTHGVGKMHFCGDPRRAWGFESRDYSEELDGSDDYCEHLARAGFAHVVDPHGFRSEYYYLPQPSQLPAHLHHTAWVADRSVDFLQRRDRGRPFFLWSSFIKPHPPFETPNPWSRLYRSAEMPDPMHATDGADHQCFWNRVQNRYKYMDGGINPHLLRTQRAAYYASISFIDFHLGRILEALGAERDNTLIIFASDHGEMLGDFGCFGKRCMLEPAVRVPLVVRYPAAFPAGEKCSVPVSLLDIFPTLIGAAGSSEPKPYEHAHDLAQIVSRRAARSYVVSQFSQRSLGLYMLAESEWKYIYSAPDRREWLFNVSDDPHELNNRLADPAASDHLKRLRGSLVSMFESHGYDWAVSGGHWRDYGGVVLPDGDREGLLFQDPVNLDAAIARLGEYARHHENSIIDWFSMTRADAMDPKTGRISFPSG